MGVLRVDLGAIGWDLFDPTNDETIQTNGGHPPCLGVLFSKNSSHLCKEVIAHGGSLEDVHVMCLPKGFT